MKIQKNDAGGESVILSPSDDLDGVPASHQVCLTSEIRRAFTGPRDYFRQIADRSNFFALSSWLQAIASSPWRLCLDDGEMFGLGMQGGFYFVPTGLKPTTVYLAKPPIPHELSNLAHFYDLLDAVQWEPFGCAGGLFSSSRLCGLSGFRLESKSDQFPVNQTFVWGSSQCGDALVCSNAGAAGLLSHETGEVQSLGTISDAIEWVFRELLNNRDPEFKYD